MIKYILMLLLLFPTLSIGGANFEALQDEIEIVMKNRFIDRWTKSFTIEWVVCNEFSRSRVYKHATKVSIDVNSCSFLCEGKYHYIAGSFIIREE